MFKLARFRLTIVYSLFFLSVLYLLSFGIYVWMDKSLGDNYVTNVKSKTELLDKKDKDSDHDKEKIIITSGEETLDRLMKILLTLDIAMLFVVPAVGYILAGKTLKPIQVAYENQNRFVSDASHELKTPLTIIRGELDLALARDRTPEEYRQAISSTRSEVENLHSLTETLLSIARGAEKSEETKETFDFVDLIIETVNTYEQKAKKKNIDLIFEQPDFNIEYVGNRSSITILIRNLLENALKYCDENGKVVIGVLLSSKSIDLQISDSGIGMTDEQKHRAFDRFYQADNARHQGGFGLGLSLCKTIVDSHKGTISLSDNNPHGLIVKVLLPFEK